jgi:hypothetical protein
MEPPPWDDYALERIRRSVAMLTPRHPAALDREAALGLLAELQHARQRDRRAQALFDQLRVLLQEADRSG